MCEQRERKRKRMLQNKQTVNNIMFDEHMNRHQLQLKMVFVCTYQAVFPTRESLRGRWLNVSFCAFVTKKAHYPPTFSAVLWINEEIHTQMVELFIKFKRMLTIHIHIHMHWIDCFIVEPPQYWILFIETISLKFLKQWIFAYNFF